MHVEEVLNLVIKDQSEKKEENKKEENINEDKWFNELLSLRILDTFKNSSGTMAKRGKNGKFYCGNTLDFPCMCCDAQCGISDGCNCSSCMKLDLLAKSMPHEYLINREGYPSRRGTTGLFYCGRRCI